MTPFCSSTGGGCHDNWTAVAFTGLPCSMVAGAEGTAGKGNTRQLGLMLQEIHGASGCYNSTLAAATTTQKVFLPGTLYS